VLGEVVTYIALGRVRVIVGVLWPRVVLSKCIGQVTLWGLTGSVSCDAQGKTPINKYPMGEEADV